MDRALTTICLVTVLGFLSSCGDHSAPSQVSAESDLDWNWLRVAGTSTVYESDHADARTSCKAHDRRLASIGELTSLGDKLERNLRPATCVWSKTLSNDPDRPWMVWSFDLGNVPGRVAGDHQCAAVCIKEEMRGTKLATKMSEEMEPRRARVSTAVKMAMNGYHIVMIGGFMNEILGGHFEDNRASLETDFSSPTFSEVYPSSRGSIRTNSEIVIARLLENYEKGGNKPLVIIAHSKGAAETLYGLTNHPDLVERGIVDKVILVQAAFGGSPVADLVTELAWFPTFGLISRWQGLLSLRPTEVRPLLVRAIHNLPERTREMLSDHFYYVVGTQDADDIEYLLQPTFRILENLYGENDGLLLSDEQMYDGFGHDLGHLYADHTDLVGSTALLTNAPRGYRKAFTRALMRQLFE
jgi:hypothetical protein